MAEELRRIPEAQAQPAAAQTAPPLDAAEQSLAHALRLSFRILTVVICFLIILFFLSGFFTVQPDVKAIILRFGRADQGLVKDQGWHYAFPAPVDKVVFVEVKPKTIEVNTFWPKVTEETRQEVVEGKEKTVTQAVKDAEGGFMLTGDLNILQARWDVTYSVKRDDISVIKYFLSLGSKEDIAGERRLIKMLLQAAVTQEISKLAVFDAYPRGKTELPDLVRNAMSEMLAHLDCGIEMDQINLLDIRPPADVKPSFDEVLAAQQVAGEMRTNAQREANSMLINAAGEVGIELGKTIDAWWTAREAGETDDQAKVAQRISELFARAGGKSRTIIAEAQTYRTSIVEEAKGDAAQLASLLGNPPEDVAIYLDHARVEALQEVFENCYEKYLYQPLSSETRGTLELWLSRRPELLREMRKIEETR